MLKRFFATFVALMVTVNFIPVQAQAANTVTEVISTERTTTSESGVMSSTVNGNVTTYTINVVENGAVTKTITFTYDKGNGDAVLTNGISRWSYKTEGSNTTVEVSTPVNDLQTLTSKWVGMSTLTSNGREISVYSNNLLIEKHYTTPSAIKVVKYSVSGNQYVVSEATTMTLTSYSVSGVTFGTLTTVTEKPISGGNSGTNTNTESGNTNSGSNNSGSGSGNTVTIKPSYRLSNLKRTTSLEKKAYKNLKKLDKLAKANGWTKYTYVRKSSSSKKVVTKVTYKGKPSNGTSYWTFTFCHIQKSKKVTYKQNGKVVDGDGVRDLIKNPANYYN